MACIGWGSAAQVVSAPVHVSGVARAATGLAELLLHAAKVPIAPIMFISCAAQSSVERVELDATQYLLTDVPNSPIITRCQLVSEPSKIGSTKAPAFRPAGPCIKEPGTSLRCSPPSVAAATVVSRTELPIAGPISKRRVLHQIAGILYHTGLLSNLTSRSASQT
ncbi:hypothetical protein CCM_03126 [Cordyceps militaris CM01]|uniref:Uncharacterized protein n=1 Tax=Cordyceps militaris (strain CM01) TaxID=983644 RepID=G3J8X2_CORMM|nr:uncharacterized protein CCM_03126 [Cordyceps militaris CM01]EGX94855.1 hypothetical protein CCM_03126 [Cordyceps militaris CM01]